MIYNVYNNKGKVVDCFFDYEKAKEKANEIKGKVVCYVD